MNTTRTDTYELEMNDNLLFRNHYDIEYVVEERDNIRIEYAIDDRLSTSYNITSDNVINLYSYTENQFEYIKNILKDLNEKKIYRNDGFEYIKVYASAVNIEKLQNNQKAYYDEQQRQEEEIRELREELENTKQELEEAKNELEKTNEEE